MRVNHRLVILWSEQDVKGEDVVVVVRGGGDGGEPQTCNSGVNREDRIQRQTCTVHR